MQIEGTIQDPIAQVDRMNQREYLCSIASSSIHSSLSIADTHRAIQFNSWPKKMYLSHTDDSPKASTIHIPQLRSQSFNLVRSLNTIGHNRLDIEHCLQKILNDLILPLLACLLDPLHLGLCILIRVFFGLLVSASMLDNHAISP